jgi:hypothetical protein
MNLNSAESFSASYDEARTRFLDAARNAGGALERIAHPERGPDGKDLSTDLAWWGPKDAERVLVLISGTHGVEGYCGSGAQVDWLRRGEVAGVPAGTAVLMIHAINPFGFAWNRRVTEDNVDLNRNWIDFGAPLPENRDYATLADAVCPAEWSEEAQRQSLGSMMQFIQSRGMPAYQQAISGGQYTHPAGLFFGGAGPTWSRRTQTEIFREKLSKASKIAIIDYHTGLGPWGFAEKIVTVPPGERHVQARALLVRRQRHVARVRHVDLRRHRGRWPQRRRWSPASRRAHLCRARIRNQAGDGRAERTACRRLAAPPRGRSTRPKGAGSSSRCATPFMGTRPTGRAWSLASL